MKPFTTALTAVLLSHAPVLTVAVPQKPAATARQLAYPTTLTSITSQTSSNTAYPNPAWPIIYQAAYTTVQTVTLLEPWTAAPTRFPYTLVQTVITRRTVTYAVTPCRMPCGTPPMTSIGATTQTALSTWLLHAPAPTDLGVDLKVASLPCAECASSAYAPDPRCEALGLDTGCQGQCRMRDGMWWCLRRRYLDGSELEMGRACWGNGDQFQQLATPCVVGDHALGCEPCKGKVISYSPVEWLGE